MIAIAIDDEPVALDVIRSHASKVPFITLEACFTNAFEAITFLRDHKVDLIFLDIKMPDISGIDFLNSLQNPPMVIFTTAYSEHAVRSFELDAVDYLLKPFSLPRFLKGCNKAHELLRLRNQSGTADAATSVFIKDGYEQVKVLVEEICYIEASGNYTQLHLDAEKMISTRVPLNEMLMMLPAGKFLRIHRAYIVAKNKVSRYDKSQVFVGQRCIPVGMTYAQVLQELKA